MKKYMIFVLLIVIFLLIISCDKDKEYDVTVRVARSGTLVWYFGVRVNDVEEFGATESGSNHPDAEQSVVFSETNQWGNYYDVNLKLKKGDHVEVIASVVDNNYMTFTTWIFVEDDMKAFAGGTSGETTLIMCSYTL